MIKLLTERKYNAGISRQVVYEWEEDISKNFNIPFEYMDSYQKHPIPRLLRKAKIKKPLSWNPRKDALLCFAMNIDLLRILTWYQSNVLPIVLDITVDEIDELYELTKKLPVFWVTAIKIKDLMLEKYPECKVCYLPQMASDRYIMEGANKDISLIQFGRRNPVLHKFALEYAEKHENVTYVFRSADPKEGMIKYSAKGIEQIGLLQTRTEFMNYLQASKICLCSTPLIDHTRDFGANIDFLTARWFEAIMSRCYIVARVSNIVTPELEVTGLDKLIDVVDNYHDFETICDSHLGEIPFPYEKAKMFSQKNSAASRGDSLIKALHEMGVE